MGLGGRFVDVWKLWRAAAVQGRRGRRGAHPLRGNPGAWGRTTGGAQDIISHAHDPQGVGGYFLAWLRDLKLEGGLLRFKIILEIEI